MNDYSVIVSSIGRTDYLIQLLGSICGQTVKPKEILVLLDDNIQGIACLRELEKHSFSPSPMTILCSGLNLPGKRNYGATLVTTEIIMYSDDDDIWRPSKAEVVLELFQNNYACICHNFSSFGKNYFENCNTLGRTSRLLSEATLLHGDNIYGGGSTICCTIHVAKAIQFDDKLNSCEDFDWWRRVHLSGAKIFYCGQDLVSYRRHTSNMGGNRRMMAVSLARLSVNSIRTGLNLVLGGLVMMLRSLIRLIR